MVLILPSVSHAQDRRAAIEGLAGYAAFLDESPIEHFTAGLSWQWRLSPRVTVGPEFVFMRGPGSDRDLFFTGKIVVEAAPAARASLYIVADGGLMLFHSDFLMDSFWVKEGAVSFGSGVRIRLTDRLYISPEVRIGWEPHVRGTIVVGWRR